MLAAMYTRCLYFTQRKHNLIGNARVCIGVKNANMIDIKDSNNNIFF